MIGNDGCRRIGRVVEMVIGGSLRERKDFDRSRLLLQTKKRTVAELSLRRPIGENAVYSTLDLASHAEEETG
ncbi:hypothetical protein IC575_002190 [Cucumis melo]